MDAPGGGVSKFFTTLFYSRHRLFLVFGQDRTLPYSLLLQKAEPIYNSIDYVRLRVADIQNIYKRLQQNIVESKENMATHQWRTAKEKLIIPGDAIFVQIHEPNNKLASCITGPHRVLQYEKGNKIKVRHAVIRGKG